MFRTYRVSTRRESLTRVGAGLALFALACGDAELHAQDLSREIAFHIARQPLPAAVIAFSEQSGIQIVTAGADVSKLSTPGVSGRLPIVTALRALLSETHLGFAPVGESTIALIAQPTDSASYSSRALKLAHADAAAALDVAALTSEAAVSGGVSSAAADSDAPLQEVVVTGTSIRGVPLVGSPLLQVTRADILATGGTTTTEVLRSVPQLASFNATGINGGQDQANFVDQPAIHGIGVGNGGAGLTLVLMDGHRLPGAGINQTAPDPGAIPASAIDHVEVIADGASAIYGSDAIAGVMNFILRKNFDGAETALKAGDGADYRTWTFSQLLGKTWGDASVMLAYEHSANTALNGTDRHYYGDNQLARGATDSRSTLCSPANVTVDDVTYGLSAAGATRGVLNRCENNVASDLYPQQYRSQAYGSLRYEAAENLELSLDSLYSERVVHNREGAASSSNSKGGLAVTVSRGPFYDFVTRLGVPAGTQAVTYNPSSDVGPAFTNDIEARTQSTTLAASLQFGTDWVAQLRGTYGVENDRVSQFGINQALAIAAAAAGTLNPYGVGPPTSPELLGQIGNYETRYSGRQTVQESQLKADGSLLGLSSGAIKGAFGISTRKEKFAAGFREGPLPGPDALPAVSSVGQRRVFSAFGELFVPLVATGAARTGLKALEVSVAVRHDHYDDVGSTTNPKFGVNWNVIEGLHVRASFGRSFHAPSLADSPTAIDTRVIRFADQTGSADPAAYSVILAGGNRLEPETANTYTTGFTWEPLFATGLSANMSYFNVKYRNVITFPTFAPVSEPGNSLFDRFRTFNPTLAEVQRQTAGYRHDGLLYPDVTGLPTAIYDLRRQNFAQQNIDGIDFDLRYRFDTTLGTFAIGTAGTRLFGFDQQIKGDTRVVSRLDTNAAVQDHLRGTLAWSRGEINASLFVNYTGAYKNTTAANRPVDSFVTLDAHVDWMLPGEGVLRDLVLSLDGLNVFDEDPPFYFDPGSNANQHGYDPVTASALGRVVSIGIRKTF